MTRKRTLIVTTSNAKMGDSGKTTGVWAEELVVPYYVLVDAGVEVEIASPLGGAVPFEPNSLKPAGENDPVVERFLNDPVAQGKVKTSRKLADLDAKTFDAIFFPGGHGTMWDLPGDPSVTTAVADAWAADKFVAAVCHGPSGLVSAKRPDGQSILQGKRVNGFTNTEEEAAGLTGVVPFALETRMRELGGVFENGQDWQPYAVRDGKLITGQNPQSSALVAQKLLAALQED
jgi:putative intracellular protease/amidase